MNFFYLLSPYLVFIPIFFIPNRYAYYVFYSRSRLQQTLIWVIQNEGYIIYFDWCCRNVHRQISFNTFISITMFIIKEKWVIISVFLLNCLHAFFVLSSRMCVRVHLGKCLLACITFYYALLFNQNFANFADFWSKFENAMRLKAYLNKAQ